MTQDEKDPFQLTLLSSSQDHCRRKPPWLDRVGFQHGDVPSVSALWPRFQFPKAALR